MKRRMAKIETNILDLLQRTEGEAMLEDDTLLNTLRDSKRLA